MRRRRLQLAAVVAVLGVLGVVAAAVAGGGDRDVRERLTGYEETPMTLSTDGFGVFKAKVREGPRSSTSSPTASSRATPPQAHIHLGARGDRPAGSARSCASPNQPTAPAGTPTCPGPREGTVRGTIEPTDVIGPSGQGIDPGDYDELLRAIRAGATYANVHSTKYPGGEIRAQLERGGFDH